MSAPIVPSSQPFLSAQPSPEELRSYFDALSAIVTSAHFVPREWQPEIQVAQRAYFDAAGVAPSVFDEAKIARGEAPKGWREVLSAVITGKATTGREAFEACQAAGGIAEGLEWYDLDARWRRGWDAVPAAMLRVISARAAYVPATRA